MIGLAVVVALAMAAVFGAMSLADPAQADIDSRPTPTAVAITADAAAEDEPEGAFGRSRQGISRGRERL